MHCARRKFVRNQMVIAQFIIISLLMTSLFSDARGSELNGLSIKEICSDHAQETDLASANLCLGILRGMIEMHGLMAPNELLRTPQTPPAFWCNPKTEGGVLVGQARAVVNKYLADHPEELNINFVWIVLRALGSAFPCPKA